MNSPYDDVEVRKLRDRLRWLCIYQTWLIYITVAVLVWTFVRSIQLERQAKPVVIPIESKGTK